VKISNTDLLEAHSE